MMSVSDRSTAIKAVVPSSVIGTYTAFAVFALVIYHEVAGRRFSVVLTLAGVVQCLGIALLCIQVLSNSHASSISVGALKIDALAIGLRLSSTTWLDGYLPVDKSGDHIYQLVDFCSLGMILFLLHRLVIVQRVAYQTTDDSFSIAPMTVASFVLAALLHGNMDDHPLFDTLWMAGLFVGVVAVLPQLWLITQRGGKTEALTGHYLAALALNRMLSGAFMWRARKHITCDEWIIGFSHAIWAILAAHLLHIVLLCDFAWCYARSLTRKGLLEPVEMSLPQWI
jgi:hypothetical protein